MVCEHTELLTFHHVTKMTNGQAHDDGQLTIDLLMCKESGLCQGIFCHLEGLFYLIHPGYGSRPLFRAGE